MGAEEEEVIERSSDIEVPKPSGKYTLVEPLSFLEEQKSFKNRCLIVLNQPLERIPVRNLWKKTSLHICADGGANRIYDYFTEKEREEYIPDFITGDLDSLKKDVAEYYHNRGSIIIPQRSQYLTDFGKSICLAHLYFNSEKSRKSLYEKVDEQEGLAQVEQLLDILHSQTIYLYVVGSLGGRFDQTIHSMSTLYSLSLSRPFLHFYFITDLDAVFLLRKGLNYILYPSKSSFYKHSDVPPCSLSPLGSDSVVLNTFGLRYDVKNWKSSMKENVSSSNGLCGKRGVIVEPSDDIIVNIAIEY